MRILLALAGLALVGVGTIVIASLASRSPSAKPTQPALGLAFKLSRQGPNLTIPYASLRVLGKDGKPRTDLRIHGLPRVFLEQDGRTHALGAFSYG